MTKGDLSPRRHRQELAGLLAISFDIHFRRARQAANR